ncbi:helix-turn-helix transcriptional regulator [Kitasatospora sp. RB6PN24]|uniref:winged helix-turn-helix transcriptional regulator n=1 Tax=Kitasatospora humi TaxID=2893891 RepID=UPI001E62D4F3|nr:helix-turn-helix domain-containing protein [Kitasatospora humi]MCC9308557.1 helix-turn-helix transcriptional regulator [Kitasatospora humi]
MTTPRETFAPAPPQPLPRGLFDPGCLPDPVPFRFSAKWAWLVLRCLEPGPRRFSELRVPLHWVTPKVLTETLRSLERDGLLTRTEFQEHPPRVEYELTTLGHSLFGPMDAVCGWAGENLDRLLAARAAHPAPPA